MTAVQTENRDPSVSRIAALELALETADAGSVHIRGRFDHEADFRYEGTLKAGGEVFQIEVQNLRASFPIEQTVRDIADAGLPVVLRAYQRDSGEPIRLVVDGEGTEISTGKARGAGLLPVIGRLITNDTP